jgi:hypothetical protein
MVKLMATTVRHEEAEGELMTARSGQWCLVSVEVNMEEGSRAGEGAAKV